MQDLKVTLIQSELAWEDIDSNLAGFNSRIDAIDQNTHLIVLPEMFSTGFTMNAAELAQDMKGSAVKWIKEKSAEKNVDMVGSIIADDGGKFYNRLVWAKPDGEIFTYDKKHLFRIWRIRPFICYDLRFPVWTRNIANQFDAAIFIANWPERRSAHWKALLQARAIENQCYMIGVNRIGIDGNGLSYSGDSSVIDPWGTIIFQKSHQTCIYTGELSYETLQKSRETFPVWMDADNDLIRLP